MSSSHSECAAVCTDPEQRYININYFSLTSSLKSCFWWQALLYLRPLLPSLLMTSPSFNHWMVGGGVPWTRQTSWMLSLSRTPISLGSSDPEMLGGTERQVDGRSRYIGSEGFNNSDHTFLSSHVWECDVRILWVHWDFTLYSEVVALACVSLHIRGQTRVCAAVRELWPGNLELAAPGEDVHLQRLWVLYRNMKFICLVLVEWQHRSPFPGGHQIIRW